MEQQEQQQRSYLHTYLHDQVPGTIRSGAAARCIAGAADDQRLTSHVSRGLAGGGGRVAFFDARGHGHAARAVALTHPTDCRPRSPLSCGPRHPHSIQRQSPPAVTVCVRLPGWVRLRAICAWQGLAAGFGSPARSLSHPSTPSRRKTASLAPPSARGSHTASLRRRAPPACHTSSPLASMRLIYRIT